LLYEPLVTSLPSDRVRAEVAERARGAVVLATTASLEDARMLGGTWHVLEGGTLDAVSDALRHGLNKALLVRSAEPRRLAAVLAADDHVSAVEWDEQRAPRELRVHGPDAAALASAVSSAALDLGLELELITPLSPSLEELLAARAALAQRAYEAAYARAPAPIFASPQSPPGSLPTPPPGYAAAPPGYHSPAAPTPDLSLDIPPTPPRKENE
jgi:hypothetical protein